VFSPASCFSFETQTTMPLSKASDLLVRPRMAIPQPRRRVPYRKSVVPYSWRELQLATTTRKTAGYEQRSDTVQVRPLSTRSASTDGYDHAKRCSENLVRRPMSSYRDRCPCPAYRSVLVDRHRVRDCKHPARPAQIFKRQGHARLRSSPRPATIQTLPLLSTLRHLRSMTVTAVRRSNRPFRKPRRHLSRIAAATGG
jgi:hypothetical protein